MRSVGIQAPLKVLMLVSLLVSGRVGMADAPATEEAGSGGHWAYQALSAPAIPQFEPARDRGWIRNPIDAFVLRQLKEQRLKHSMPASRRILLRRLSFDLTGLPPTPAELDAFLTDDTPGAYERAVERLLGSPHYGERWARHWMDLAHFAESHGHDQDRPRENAWPYRDYLIRSFNDDTPYAHFVKEQLAGDILYPLNPWAVVATGFMAAGPWDESSLRDIREDSIDREIARYIDRDDIVTLTMSTFASTTVHCARCHDHKFDPVSQTDYYNLQAVFAGVDKADRPYDPDPELAARRRELMQRLEGLPRRLERLDPALLAATLQAEIDAWSEPFTKSRWQVVPPDGYRSANGSTLTLNEDGSLLSGGERPDKDTYTIVGRSVLRRVTAVRLEVLTDGSLFRNGPGRQDNGNLHLNEFTVRVENGEGGWIDVELVSAKADFDQAGWTSAMAIDHNPATAWGIYPEVGAPHQVVFFPRHPLTNVEGRSFTFELKQIHGGGHLIGRARLSVTDVDAPTLLQPLPAGILALLAIPAGARTDRQRAELAVHYLRSRTEQELGRLPPTRLVYAGSNDFKPDGSFKPAEAPRAVHVLRRGNIASPGPEARPGALGCLPGLPASFVLSPGAAEGERRVALARWLTDRKNALVWRSIVNRVWQHHFGAGLVDTPNDFGEMGAQPSHPELLDWLARWFLDHGGSIKALHRLIVTSATYRQSSDYESANAVVDANNRFLWRMNRRRLDAESMRDAVLFVAGRLDTTMGGPSVKQFNQKPGVHVTPEVDYLNFDADDPANYRRSVYRFVFRTLPDPLMEALDFPDSSLLTAARTESLTPLQALALMNSRFLVRQSEHLAERLEAATTGAARQVEELYRLALGREPSEAEKRAVIEYVGKHGLANACRFVLNSNEFAFVD